MPRARKEHQLYPDYSSDRHSEPRQIRPHSDLGGRGRNCPRAHGIHTSRGRGGYSGQDPPQTYYSQPYNNYQPSADYSQNLNQNHHQPPTGYYNQANSYGNQNPGWPRYQDNGFDGGRNNYQENFNYNRRSQMWRPESRRGSSHRASYLSNSNVIPLRSPLGLELKSSQLPKTRDIKESQPKMDINKTDNQQNLKLVNTVNAVTMVADTNMPLLSPSSSENNVPNMVKTDQKAATPLSSSINAEIALSVIPPNLNNSLIEDQTERSSNMTSNTKIVQVAASGHREEYAKTMERSTKETQSHFLTKESQKKKKKTVFKDIDERFGQPTQNQTEAKPNTASVLTEKSSHSFCERTARKEKQSESPTFATAKAKDWSLSAMLPLIACKFSTAGKDSGSKIAKPISVTESSNSVDTLTLPNAKVTVDGKESTCEDNVALLSSAIQGENPDNSQRHSSLAEKSKMQTVELRDHSRLMETKESSSRLSVDDCKKTSIRTSNESSSSKKGMSKVSEPPVKLPNETIDSFSQDEMPAAALTHAIGSKCCSGMENSPEDQATLEATKHSRPPSINLNSKEVSCTISDIPVINDKRKAVKIKAVNPVEKQATKAPDSVSQEETSLAELTLSVDFKHRGSVESSTKVQTESRDRARLEATKEIPRRPSIDCCQTSTGSSSDMSSSEKAKSKVLRTHGTVIQDETSTATFPPGADSKQRISRKKGAKVQTAESNHAKLAKAKESPRRPSIDDCSKKSTGTAGQDEMSTATLPYAADSKQPISRKKGTEVQTAESKDHAKLAMANESPRCPSIDDCSKKSTGTSRDIPSSKKRKRKSGDHDQQANKAHGENKQRRTSSSSLSDASDWKCHRSSTEKGSLDKSKERSGKESTQSSKDRTKIRSLGKDVGNTGLIIKPTSAGEGITKYPNISNSLTTKGKIDQVVRKSTEKQCSSGKFRSNEANTSTAAEVTPADKAQRSANIPVSSKKQVVKHSSKSNANLASRDKTARDSSSNSKKIREHCNSQMSSSDCETVVKKTSFSSEKSSNLNDCGNAQQTHSYHKMNEGNDTKLPLAKSVKKNTSQVIDEVKDNKNLTQELNEMSSTKHSKDLSKRKCDGKFPSESSPKKLKLPSKPSYKMTREEWMLRGKPSVDTFKGIHKPCMPLVPLLASCPLPVHEAEVTSLGTDPVNVEVEKPVEQYAGCKKPIPPPEGGLVNSTDLTSDNEETLTPTENNMEVEEKTLIRFQGNMRTISEAHIPVITIRDDNDAVPVPVATSTISEEHSGVDPNTILDKNISNILLKEENELIIDDSNFLSGVSVKEEEYLNSNSEIVYLPQEDFVELKPLIASPLASGVLWARNPDEIRDFPGRAELTKLVEYFILLNQDLIKYNDSVRIASRLDETLRIVHERRATSDLFLVIKKVKPIIEELVNLAKGVVTPDGDLLESIYINKEVLPSDALKLKADTLSRKAIADIFRLVSEGDLDEIGFYQSSTVIVYNKEQGLSNMDLAPNIKPESMNQRCQSVIRNYSHKPIEQNVITQCAICELKASIPCGICEGMNVCSKNHMREH